MTMKYIRSLCLALALLPFAAFATTPVDINTASVADLEQVKGIGPVKAGAIVQYRTDHGAFKSIDDLVNVPGIGEKSVEQFREQLTVGDSKTDKTN